MPTQLTRDDIKTMTDVEIEKARKAGQLDDALGRPTVNADESEAQDPPGGKKIDRRKQEPRSAMLNLNADAFAEKLGTGTFDAILDGATHVLDADTGNVYDIVSTNEADLSPVVKAKDAANEDNEDLAEKLFENWVPLTKDIYVVAREQVQDKNIPASKWPLPLKPARQDAIKAGDMVVVDPDNRAAVLCQIKTEKEQKADASQAASEEKRKDEARSLGRSPAIDGF